MCSEHERVPGQYRYQPLSVFECQQRQCPVVAAPQHLERKLPATKVKDKMNNKKKYLILNNDKKKKEHKVLNFRIMIKERTNI
jgi:hypothetical protein